MSRNSNDSCPYTQTDVYTSIYMKQKHIITIITVIITILQTLKPGWNGYMSISFSAGKVSWKRMDKYYYFFKPTSTKPVGS